MKRPARIRILGKQFTITFVPEDHPGLESAENAGMCNANKQTIHIEDGQPIESEQDTVLHEVMHGVESLMGMDIDEAIIRNLATGLLAVIKDNPTFVRYLATRAPKHVKV